MPIQTTPCAVGLVVETLFTLRHKNKTHKSIAVTQYLLFCHIQSLIYMGNHWRLLII